MKRLKNTVVAASLALCAGAYAPLAGASGIPTVDVASIAQEVMQQMETMEQWTQQLEQAQKMNGHVNKSRREGC
jgi:hypothetical protein